MNFTAEPDKRVAPVTSVYSKVEREEVVEEERFADEGTDDEMEEKIGNTNKAFI